MITILGQPAVFVKDLQGKEYPAMTETNRIRRVNGQREISLSFYNDTINNDFIDDIEFGWKILFKGEWYTITGPTYAIDGDTLSVGIDAVLSFFVDMNGHYMQDEATDESSTPGPYFIEVFKGTDYDFVIVDNLSANTLNYQANQSKTERFLYGVDRFKGEYVIRDKLAYIYELIGSDKDVILHEDLNIKDVSVQVDGSGFHTWARGFGDKDDSEQDADYKLEVEYASPSLVDKYGPIEGPAIRDGSYKHEDNLREAIKNQVENSLRLSTTITPVDLTKNGYPEMQFEEGDRIWVYVSKLKMNAQVRVVEIDELFDWEGSIIDAQYDVGNQNIVERYKTDNYDAIKDFKDVIDGRKKIDFDWLPDAIRRASDIINGNLDSHFMYGAGEIIGINKSNPNGYMRFNTDGIGFSRDAGKNYNSAMTYEGIVADAITSGALRTNNVLIIGDENYFYWDGNALTAIDRNNPNTRIDLTAGLLDIQEGAIRIQGKDGRMFVIDGIPNISYNVQFSSPAFRSDGVEVFNQWNRTISTTNLNCDMGTFRHEGRYLRINVAHRMASSGTSSGAVTVIGLGSWANIINASFVFDNSAEDGSEYHTFTIDLGVPTYQEVNFYVQLRTGAANRAAYTRILRAGQVG